MKKLLAALLALLLAGGCTALGEYIPYTHYDSTRAFLAEWEENYGSAWYLCALNEDKVEQVGMKVARTNGTFHVFMCFEEDPAFSSIWVRGIISFEEKDLLEELRLCNRLNSEWVSSRFYVEEDEYGYLVSCRADVICHDLDNLGDIMCQRLFAQLEIVNEEGYPLLKPYDRTQQNAQEKEKS